MTLLLLASSNAHRVRLLATWARLPSSILPSIVSGLWIASAFRRDMLKIFIVECIVARLAMIFRHLRGTDYFVNLVNPVFVSMRWLRKVGRMVRGPDMVLCHWAFVICRAVSTKEARFAIISWTGDVDAIVIWV